MHIRTYSYDTENQLVTATRGTDVAEFTYDPLSRQTQKDFNSSKTRFVYNGWQRIADYDGTSGSLQARYVYGSGLDEPLLEVSSSGEIAYFYRDRNGSVVARSNGSGAVTERHSYSPFGERSLASGTSFGFTGHRCLSGDLKNANRCAMIFLGTRWNTIGRCAQGTLKIEKSF
jgi:hypothetical protein